MKRAEDLSYEKELLKTELNTREVEENLRRKMEPEMKKSYTSIVGHAKPVDTAKREPEIEERLLKKQKKAQNEPNPTKIGGDAIETTLEEETGESVGRRR